MTERLRFGTAGLRAAVGDGPDRMNERTVALATRAVASWLPDGALVVVGRDARHGSAEFSRVVVGELLAAGATVERFDEPVPTPLVAYRVATSPAAAGIVITASHNPATDNGMKVYGADGAQILPDAAAAIEAAMDSAPVPADLHRSVADSTVLGPEVIDEYTFAVGRGVSSESLNVVYTAMHGVGGELAVRLLTEAGHTVYPVAEQFDPDPEFSTAPFPNPEEPGALDLAVAFANRLGTDHIDLVLAHDPDADRLAVWVPRAGRWAPLTGDDVGVLLAERLLSRSSGPRTVATTIVSSSLLDAVAAHHGAACRRTLTGFKWLVADDDPDRPLVFAYEEALGYLVNPLVRDKDGLSAALVFCELAAALRAEGRTVLDELERIHERHGVHGSSQVSLRFEGDDPMSAMTEVMSALRRRELEEIGGRPVLACRDLLADDDLPASDVLVFTLAGGRVIVRPSGTEPKLKIYLEAIDVDRATVDDRLARLGDAARQLVSV